MATIIPAILTDDEDVYCEQLQKAQHAAEIVQIDIVDGKFAQNLTIGPEVIAKYPTSANLEIQIMALDNLFYINDLVNLDFVFRIIVPYEKNEDLKECIYTVRGKNKQIGISLNPATTVLSVSDLFDDIDLLLLLGVEPGFPGQKFQAKVLDKIKEAKELARSLAVEVDGGVNFETAPQIAAAGADFLAANSVLFKAEDFYVAFDKISKMVGFRGDSGK